MVSLLSTAFTRCNRGATARTMKSRGGVAVTLVDWVVSRARRVAKSHRGRCKFAKQGTAG